MLLRDGATDSGCPGTGARRSCPGARSQDGTDVVDLRGAARRRRALHGHRHGRRAALRFALRRQRGQGAARARAAGARVPTPPRRRRTGPAHRTCVQTADEGNQGTARAAAARLAGVVAFPGTGTASRRLRVVGLGWVQVPGSRLRLRPEGSGEVRRLPSRSGRAVDRDQSPRVAGANPGRAGSSLLKPARIPCGSVVNLPSAPLWPRSLGPREGRRRMQSPTTCSKVAQIPGSARYAPAAASHRTMARPRCATGISGRASNRPRC